MSNEATMVETFNNQGYFVLKNVISPQFSRALYDCVTELQSKVEGRPITAGTIYVADEWDADNLGWGDRHALQHPILREFVRHPDFIRPLGLMAGGQSDPELADWAIHQTDPGDGGLLWHQDVSVLDAGATIGISMMVMETADVQPNYQLIPGSQDGPPAPVEEQMTEVQPGPGEQVVALSDRDVLVHSPLIWHTAIPNASDKAHRRLLMYFQPGSG